MRRRSRRRRRTPLPVPRGRRGSRLAETLNDMLARLETAFEHERRFVADASHELRTPLALLRTELELALRRPRSRDELEDALRSAVEETDRLSRSPTTCCSSPAPTGVAPDPPPTRCPPGTLLAESPRLSPPCGVARPTGRASETATSSTRPRSHRASARQPRRERARPRGGRRSVPPRREAWSSCTSPTRGPASPRIRRARLRPLQPGRRGTPPEGQGLGLSIVEAIAVAHGGQAVAANLTHGADVWLELPLRT